MSGQRLSAIASVWLGKHDHVGVIGSGVETDGKPEAPRPAQGQTPEETVERNAQRVDPSLVGFENQMDEAEETGGDGRSRPETDSFGQSFEGVTAKEELLCEPDREKGQPPFRRGSSQVDAMQGESMERAAAGEVNGNENEDRRDDPPQESEGESSPRTGDERQSVGGELFPPDPGHGPCDGRDTCEIQ